MKRTLLSIALLVVCLSLKGQVVINEICPANADINYDPQYYNFSGWIELYNPSSSAVSISGFYLSDDASQKTKWRVPSGTSIPAKGYKLIWCDDMNTSLHTNFSLDSDGEELILSNASQTRVDDITFPEQYTNISYGRTSDGGPTWGYLINPTPATKNNEETASDRLENPVLSLSSGRYSGTQTLTMAHALSGSGVVIRYTVDGSEPTASSVPYQDPISIANTATVKAKAFHPSNLPSKTEVKTYFINEHAFTLPVISLSTKPAYLWDNTIGIYADGTNGIPGNCQGNPVNWNQDWDRHAVFEYFKVTGEKEFDQSVDIRIGGACSRNNPQKSFVIKARDKYGKNTIDEKIFTSKDINEFGGFILRNAGNDFYATMFRDAMVQSLTIGQMDIDYLAYQPTTFYLNGQYWGVQNLREKIDGDYIEANYGIDKDDIDLVETWGNAVEGTSVAYYQYLDSLQRINLADPQSFKFIDRHIDVQEYINYLTTEIYTCNTDWPGNNVKFWRQRSTNGKFRWILWDLDFSFALYENQSYATHPTLNFATDPNSGVGWPNPPESTLHIRLLLQNPVFRDRFIQTLTAAMGTTFKPERINEFVDTFQDGIKAEMPYHVQRWGQSMDNWNYQVQRLRDFGAARYVFMQGHIADFFGLDETVKVSATAIPTEAGTFNFNGVASDEVTNATYYKALPYQIKPVAKPGFVFKNWKIKKRESTAVALIDKENTWKYFDLGSLPDPAWIATTYNDNTWQEGGAQLGYGDTDEQTVVSFGSDSNNKFVTTYFRKSFSVADTVGLGSISATALFDDGIIIYLNGIEVYRNNMPGGVVNTNTLATQAIPVENTFSSFGIPKGLLKPGQNVLAAEVHQNSVTSSDISFDFAMSTVKLGNEVELTSTVANLSDTAYTDVILEAVFEVQSIDPIDGIVINEFSAAPSWVTDDFNESEDWIELYNTGTSTVNLAGLFITDNLSNKTKYKLKEGVGNEMLLSPGAYKILWADEDTEQGARHLNIKLSADGEAIGLYQIINGVAKVLDEITFDTQVNNVSYSRIPNATGPFMITSTLTPGATNQLEVPTGMEEDLEKSFEVYPNPTSGNISIQSELPLDGVKVYDSRGKLIQEFSSMRSGDQIPFVDNGAGLYILAIRTGNKTAMKRVVKIH